MKFALSVFTMAVIFGISYLVYIFGWGLQPQSWGWILGGGFVQIIVLGIIEAAKE